MIPEYKRHMELCVVLHIWPLKASSLLKELKDSVAIVTKYQSRMRKNSQYLNEF